MSVWEIASETGMWIKEVSTTIFYKRFKKLLKPDLKNIIILSLIAVMWIVFCYAGYLYYRHMKENYIQNVISRMTGELQNNANQRYRSIMDASRDLSIIIGNSIEFEKENIKRNLEIEKAPLNNLMNFNLFDNQGNLLAQLNKESGKSLWLITEKLKICEDIDITVSVPYTGDIFVTFSSLTAYAGSPNGKIDLIVSSSMPSSLMRYGCYLVLWCIIVVPLILTATLHLADCLLKFRMELKSKKIITFIVAFAEFRNNSVINLKEDIALKKLRCLKLTEWILNEEKQDLEHLLSDADIHKNQIGDYLILKTIAKGGMAEVLIAKKMGPHGFENIFAIKKILPHLADNKDFREMFIAEAKKSAVLKDQNIVQIFELKEFKAGTGEKNELIISMEYIHGKNLADIVDRLSEIRKYLKQQSVLPVNEAVYIMTQICYGLKYAHEYEIIHRDISPQNILLSFRGEVKITDFGIAKATNAADTETQTGVVKGKLNYMAPEQIMGKVDEIDYQSDIYALGIVFYEMFAGKRPYHFEDIFEAIDKIKNLIIPPLNEAVRTIPKELNDIVMKCLEKEKGMRYEHVSAIINDLGKFRQGYHLKSDNPAEELSKFLHTVFKPILPSLMWKFAVLILQDNQ